VPCDAAPAYPHRSLRLVKESTETEKLQEVRELVRAEMVGAYDLDPPLAVDVGVGENWAEAKK
jgi:DNA polymerase I-like protein with 3'-5' exonuclease and polymerase domains